MVGFARPLQRKAAKGRVIALFGAPGVGTTSVACVLRLATNKTCALVTSLDEIAEVKSKSDVVLLDSVQSSDDVKQLVVDRFIDPTQGCVVQIADHNAEPDDEWLALKDAIEAAINNYALPYHVIHNQQDDLEVAVAELARIAQLRS